MKSKAVIALAIAATFVISAGSVLFTDNSEAIELTDGETALGYSVENLSATDVDTLYDDDWKYEKISDVWENLVSESYGFNTSGQSVSGYSEKAYIGLKIDGDVYTNIETRKASYKIQFTKTCTSDYGRLFENYEYNVDLLKGIGFENEKQNGSTFTVTADVEETVVSESTYTIDKDTGVVTEGSEKAYTLYKFVANVTYNYVSEETPKSISYTMDYSKEISYDVDVTFDFMGKELKDVKQGDPVLYDSFNISDDGQYTRYKVTVGDSTRECESELPYLRADGSYDSAFTNAIVVADSFKLPTPVFYKEANSTEAFFSNYSDIQNAMKSDDALRTFFTGHGSVYDSYSDVASEFDSLYQSVATEKKDNSKLIYYGAIGGLAVVAVVLGVLLIRKR